MLITHIDKPAKPASLFILYGILHGYLDHPAIVILRSLIRARTIGRGLNRNLPEDIKQLLALTMGIYSTLKQDLDPDQALALIQAVMIPLGLINQIALFRYVEEPDHTMANLIAAAKRFKEQGPMRLNRHRICEQSENRYTFKVHNCIFVKIFSDNGCPELSTVFCAVDHALYNIYSPGRILFSRGGSKRTIAAGNASCDFICEAADR
jgi:hypothetical protein